MMIRYVLQPFAVRVYTMTHTEVGRVVITDFDRLRRGDVAEQLRF
jgi:hypothetical protein